MVTALKVCTGDVVKVREQKISSMKWWKLVNINLLRWFGHILRAWNDKYMKRVLESQEGN